MEAGDIATLAPTNAPSPQPVSSAPTGEQHAPESPATESAAPRSPRTGQPITQSEVDQLYSLIQREVEDRSNFMRSLDQERTPMGLVHHGMGAYAVVCDDGTSWKFHGDAWEPFGTPIPGTRADLVAKLKADTEQRAQERQDRAAAAATPPAPPATPADG